MGYFKNHYSNTPHIVTDLQEYNRLGFNSEASSHYALFSKKK